MSEVLLKADKVSLSVPVFQPSDRQLMTNPMQFITDLYLSRTKRGIAYLLNDISMEVRAGERIGIIGANGAGKSTLLRLLAGIYKPTTGNLITNGTVKGLFDISLGMNMEATGLENIYMRGLQMGFDFPEIRGMIPDILEFSELENDIEKPLNTYSTGMRLRLAVAVSTTRSPDLLLLDEWIGTGDMRFREKIKERMDQLVEQAHGLVIATHNTGLMKSLCTRGIVLDGGNLVYQGGLNEALAFYEEEVRAVAAAKK